MPLILAVDGDKRQSTQVAALVKASIEADMVQAATAAEGLKALNGRVPDLILTSSLLSPKDDGIIAGHLRQLGRAAAHVQTLTIPMLRKGAQKAKAQRGVLAALRRGKPTTPATDGCDPQVFADQVRLYLETAAQYRESSVPDSDDRPGDGAIAAASQVAAEPVAETQAAGWSTAETGTLEAPDVVPAEVEAVSFESTSGWAQPYTPSTDAVPMWVEADAPASTWTNPAPVHDVFSAAAPPEIDAVPSVAAATPDDTGGSASVFDASASGADETLQPGLAIGSQPAAEPTYAGDTAHADTPAEHDTSFEAVASVEDVPGADSTAWSTTDDTSAHVTADAGEATVEARDVSVAALEALFGFDSLDEAVAVDGVDGDLASPADAATGTGAAVVGHVAPVTDSPAIERFGAADEIAAPVIEHFGAAAGNDAPVIEHVGAAADVEHVAAVTDAPVVERFGEAESVALETAEPDARVDAPETANARAVAAFVQEPDAFDDFYVQTPAADAWAALTTQPLSALTRPEEHTENRVPMVDMGACEDLDLLASGLAAPGSPAAGMFVPPTPSRHDAEPQWLDADSVVAHPAAGEFAATAEPAFEPAEPSVVETAAVDEAFGAEQDAAPAQVAAANAPFTEAPDVEIDLDAVARAAIEPPAEAVLTAPDETVVPVVLDDAVRADVVPDAFDEADLAAAMTEDDAEADTRAEIAAAVAELDAARANGTTAAATPAAHRSADDDGVPDVKPLLYEVFADEFEEALESEADSGTTVAATSASTPDRVSTPGLVTGDATSGADGIDDVFSPSAAWLAQPAHQEAAALSATTAIGDTPAHVVGEFLGDDGVPAPAVAAEAGPLHGGWTPAVLDDAVLAMIGDAAFRAFDDAVLRDFETALAACDDDTQARPGADDPPFGTGGNGGGITSSTASPSDSAPSTSAAEAVAATRGPVEFESKPQADEWASFGGGQTPIAALVDKRSSKNDRTRDGGPDRAKARVAAH